MGISSVDLTKIGKDFVKNYNKTANMETPITKGTGKFVHEKIIGKPQLKEDTFAIDFLNGKYDEELNNKITYQSEKYQGELLRIEVPKSIKPTEIEEIQNGTLGIVRKKSELSTKEIAKIIKFQQESFSPKEIENIINSFPEDDRAIVGELFTRITQFANYDALPELVKQSKGKIIEDRLTGLGSTIRYLSKHEGTFSPKPEFVENDGAFIIDKIFMERIESDKEYLEEILSKNPHFILPEGFVNGINIFNQTQDAKPLLEQFLKRFKTLKKSHSELSDSQLIEVSINLPVIKKLKSLGIKPEVIKNSSVSEESIPVSEKIAKQLNGHIISEDIIKQTLSRYTPQEQQYVLEILAHTLNTKNTKAISQKLQDIHKILRDIHNGSEEGIYYVIPQEVKSYSLITTQYQHTVGIHPSKIINLEDIDKLPDDAVSLVVLDDLAGSGESLEGAYNSIINKLNYSKNDRVKDIFLAPIMSTPEAHTRLNGISLSTYRCTCIPAEITEGFCGSKYFNSLQETQRSEIKELIGGGGYEGGALSVALPYMAPDNNSQLFSNKFAYLFTLNGSGVKRRGTIEDIENLIMENMMKNLTASGK